MERYWTKADRKELKRAKTLKELLKIAMRIFQRMPQPIGQVCGPITSGGFGSIEKNMKVFRAAIKRLSSEDKNIFDQAPFEPAMRRICPSNDPKQRKRILTEFYRPIFESGLVKQLYFLPNWQTSVGARWENVEAHRLEILIIYLENNFIQKLNPRKPPSWP